MGHWDEPVKRKALGSALQGWVDAVSPVAVSPVEYFRYLDLPKHTTVTTGGGYGSGRYFDITPSRLV